jgi:hypothetical protein
MKRLLLVILVIALYLLHQDFWFWRTAQPLVFGFLPIGLFYHACFTVATALLMWLLVKQAWPEHLEDGQGDWETGGLGEEEMSNSAKHRPVALSPRRPVADSEEGKAR